MGTRFRTYVTSSMMAISAVAGCTQPSVAPASRALDPFLMSGAESICSSANLNCTPSGFPLLNPPSNVEYLTRAEIKKPVETADRKAQQRTTDAKIGKGKLSNE